MNRRRFLALIAGSTSIASYGLYHYFNPSIAVTKKADIPSGKNTVTLNKVKNFENDFSDDIYLDRNRIPVLHAVRDKLTFIQSYVGYANYSVLGFNDMLRFAKYQPKVGPFSKQEMDLIMDMFAVNVHDYGFYGERVNFNISDKISDKQITKVPHTGQYLFKGESLRMYKKLRADVGEEMILTSGVRSIVKQILLFANKAVNVDGNLSRASRSLAPPGHSFHAVGDFDVGMKGFGRLNFTSSFEDTDVYKRIEDLAYIKIRYDKTNSYGVRYEPWHIKVV